MESKNLIIRETVFDDCKYFAEWEKLPEVTEFFTIDEGRDYEQVVTEFVRYNLDPTKLLPESILLTRSFAVKAMVKKL